MWICIVYPVRFSGTDCTLWAIVIAKKYNYASYPGVKIDKGICHSHWNFDRDITNSLFAVTRSSFHNAATIGTFDKATDGIYVSLNPFLGSTGGFDANPWVRFEFNPTKMLEAIILKTRQGTGGYVPKMMTWKLETSVDGTTYQLFYVLYILRLVT